MGQQRAVKYLPDQDIVLVITSGTYILGAEIDTLEKAIEVSQQCKCKKLLFDHRKATVVARTLESYDRPTIYENLGFDRITKLASLVSEINDELRFYETVCRNRGWQMRVFDEYADAAAWLAKT